MQDIVNADNVKANQTAFNTLFNTENMANFYAMRSSSPLACHHSEKCEDSNIEDETSQPLDNLVPRQK